MQCFDIVLVPSYTEGFSLAALEAQAAGTPALVTAGVPREADMGLGLFHALPLDAGASGWLTRMSELLTSTVRPGFTARSGAIRAKGYDAKQSAQSILSLYGFDTEPSGGDR
jgi:glycosyltransferase EpsF